jgi:hypothetical protein
MLITERSPRPQVPCKRAFIVFLAAICVMSSRCIADAALGGVAARGDNCTPFNPFQIGLPQAGVDLPEGSVVNESVLLAGGWRVAGWILTIRSGRRFLVAAHINGTETAQSLVPGTATLYPMSSADFQREYYTWRARVAAKSPITAKQSFVDPGTPIIAAPCFKAPLLINR